MQTSTLLFISSIQMAQTFGGQTKKTEEMRSKWNYIHICYYFVVSLIVQLKAVCWFTCNLFTFRSIRGLLVIQNVPFIFSTMLKLVTKNTQQIARSQPQLIVCESESRHTRRSLRLKHIDNQIQYNSVNCVVQRFGSLCLLAKVLFGFACPEITVSYSQLRAIRIPVVLDQQKHIQMGVRTEIYEADRIN